MRVSIVVAVSENGVIGVDNKLPWRIPEDLARFKKITMGNTLLMGRKTFESIGRALPGRTSLVLTRDREYSPPEGVLVAHEIEEAMEKAPGPEIFVVGGAEIYGQLLPRTDRIYLTRVRGYYEGDTYFRGLDQSQWTLSQSTPSEGCTFEVYERNGDVYQPRPLGTP
jgi:dihydrofolate reductase